MTEKQPPVLGTWLLKRAARGNEALVGDLLEEYRRGRSAAWYWRQVLTTVVVGGWRPAALALGVVAVYLIGSYVSVPGANASVRALQERRAVGTPFQLFHIMFGGQLTGVTIFALGINPYINAAFIAQTGALVWRFMTRHSERPRPFRIVALTWSLAILLCTTQAVGLAAALERVSLADQGLPIVAHPGWTFRITTMLTLTAGTTILMAISDQISKRRIGNGMLLVFGAGIAVSVAGLSGLLLAGDIDPVGLATALARNTIIATIVSYGYHRAIERELVA